MKLISIEDVRVRQRGRLVILATIPFIYMMVIPIAFLDVMVQFYQWVCFSAYGLALVERKRFVNLSGRGRAVLSGVGRVHCLYCAYANGVLNYARAVAGETEKYWCPIKQHLKQGEKDLEHRKNFVEDGDAEALAKRLEGTKY